MATANKPITTWQLSCPECGSKDAIHLDLNGMETVTCSACDEIFAPETACHVVAEQLRRWEALVAWIAMAGSVLAETKTK